jgi:hypothetical protein
MRLLTSEQLEQLTGYRQKAAQVRWLQKNGVRHYVRADGHPNVPESALDAPMTTRNGPKLDAARRAS